MNLIKMGHCGLVLDTEGCTRQIVGAGRTAPFVSNRGTELTGHFILLDRYHVDDDGNICLTPSLPLRELHGAADIIKAELESLLEQVHQRFPHASPHSTAVLAAIKS